MNATNTKPATKKRPGRAPNVMGAGEIAERLGVTNQLVNSWAKALTFPVATELGMGRVWRTIDIMAWCSKHRPDLAKVAGW